LVVGAAFEHDVIRADIDCLRHTSFRPNVTLPALTGSSVITGRGAG